MTAIDIILPYYNGSKYIKEQLESIERNDTEDIELRLIILNDASSTDETEYLKSILPSNTLYIENEKNLGVIKTVEKGLEISTAPYIMLCDQDDIWLPNKIKHSLNKLKDIEGNGPALVYTDLVIVDKDLKTIHPSMHAYYKHDHDAVYPSILFHNIVTGCTVIFNRKLLEFTLPFPEKITMHDHWVAICGVFLGNIEFLDEITILYRQHAQNQVGAPSRNTISRLFCLKESYEKFSRGMASKKVMTKALLQRLPEDIATVNKLKAIINAIESYDILYLMNKEIVGKSYLRRIGFIIFFIIRK